MPTKTERILALLPRTFRAHPRPTALHALAEAFGGELLRAENALAEVMQSHWVDHADRGAGAVDDLRRMAALYGLAPRPRPMPEETVEEFRQRLKRHVRTFMDGTATVRGVLRVTADALALRIDDEHLDAWWSRTGPAPTLVRPRADDAARTLFGVPHAGVRGHPARAAAVRGPVLSGDGVDLREGALLRLSVDGANAVTADCAAGAQDPARVPLSAVVDAVNAAAGAAVASADDGRLVLSSPTRGSASSLDVLEVRGDAAPVLLGLPARIDWGRAAVDAEIRGTADLPDPLDLSRRRFLRIAVDRARLAEVDCAGPDAAATPLSHVVAAINGALGPVASLRGARLVLRSPLHGAAGSLSVQEPGAQDAAPLLLGDAPRQAEGRDPAPAEMVGAVALGPEIDLSEVFAVRVRQDDRRAVTVDAAGAIPGRTRPDEAAARLAAALAPGTAAFDGRLRLSSGTAGPDSRLEIRPVVSTEDAAPRLLGIRPRGFQGAPAAPAVLRGTVEIPETRRLHVQPGAPADTALPKVEAGNAVEVDLRGPRRLHEVEGTGLTGARLSVDLGDGRFVAVGADGTPGGAGAWTITGSGGTARLPLDARGLPIRAVRLRLDGPAAEPPQVTAVVVRAGVDVRVHGRLLLAVDGGREVEVDLRAGAADPEHATAAELRQAINAAMAAAGGDWIASVDAGRLVLASATRGTAGSLELRPLETVTALPFLVRAFVVSEAASVLLGVPTARAAGTDAGPARLVGTRDLSRGVDLRVDRWLRIRVDGHPAIDVDCGDGIPRPRNALPGEIAAAINAGLRAVDPRLDGCAQVHGGRLSITSRWEGAAARVALEPPRPEDARHALLGREPGLWRGHDGRRVTFAGTADLSRGVDLSAGDRLRVFANGTEREVACAGADPAHTALPEIITAINVAFADLVARSDGAHLVLFTAAPGGVLEIRPPSQRDATRALLGIDAPRTYTGDPPLRAEVTGAAPLPAAMDLRRARRLRVAINGAPPVDVDAAAGAADPAAVTPAQVRAALDAALGAGTAALDAAGRLVLATAETGSAARIELLAYESADARALLFGAEVEPEAVGRAPTQAAVKGLPDLRQTADLSLSRTLRVSIDGGRPVEVEVAAAYPERAEVHEVLAAFEQALPGVASVTADGELVLASPSAGRESGVEVLPVRSLDVVEFPAAPHRAAPLVLRHDGRSAELRNDGAADADAVVELRAPQGAASPALVNPALGAWVRLGAALGAGEGVRFARDPEVGVRAWILPAEREGVDQAPAPVSPEQVFAGSSRDTARVPFAGERRLTSGRPGEPWALRLEDPRQPRAVVLRARTRRAAPVPPATVGEVETPRLVVRVADAAPGGAPTLAPEGGPARLRGMLALAEGHWVLRDGAGTAFTRVLPGLAVPLAWHADRVVAAEGPLHEGEPGEIPTLVARRVDRLYDVEVREDGEGGAVQTFAGVSIGSGDAADSLVRRAAAAKSPLVVAEEEDRAAFLSVPRGRSAWTYVECHGARFDHAPFGRPPHRADPLTRFPGGAGCLERGIHDVSRFGSEATGYAPGGAVFAGEGDDAPPPVEVRAAWTRHAPGAFDLLLPAVLPDFLGGAFDASRFGGEGQAERYSGVVTEPEADPEHIIAAINGTRTATLPDGTREAQGPSRLVIARRVARVPIGFTGIPIPLRRPRVRRLLLGREGQPARLYLVDPDVPLVIELTAKDAAESRKQGRPVEAPGAWGNAIEIEVSPTPGGPGRFDVSVRFAGGRAESARTAALGGEHTPATAAEINAPGPVGVLHAKAAGVAARVLRERAGAPEAPSPTQQERPS
jgi:hypothetical protein